MEHTARLRIRPYDWNFHKLGNTKRSHTWMRCATDLPAAAACFILCLVSTTLTFQINGISFLFISKQQIFTATAVVIIIVVHITYPNTKSVVFAHDRSFIRSYYKILHLNEKCVLSGMVWYGVCVGVCILDVSGTFCFSSERISYYFFHFLAEWTFSTFEDRCFPIWNGTTQLTIPFGAYST